jgi:hypothetical protein|tara:strand:- start:271 stop:498 length:228 start_codon:yes stop_codon:yes gene_type:complete
MTTKMDPKQIQKILKQYLAKQKKIKGSKLKSPGANIAGQSLAKLIKGSDRMLKGMTTAKKGGRIKKKGKKNGTKR